MTLREARDLIGWSQEVLAEEAGLSLSTVQRIETHKHAPSIDRCRAIVSAFRAGGLRGLSLDSIEWTAASVVRKSSSAA